MVRPKPSIARTVLERLRKQQWQETLHVKDSVRRKGTFELSDCQVS